MSIQPGKRRDRFRDNVKVFQPKLVTTDNFGKHSPGKHYEAAEGKDNVIESRPKYSFSKDKRAAPKK